MEMIELELAQMRRITGEDSSPTASPKNGRSASLNGQSAVANGSSRVEEGTLF